MVRPCRRLLSLGLLAAALPFTALAAMTTAGQFGVDASGAAGYSIPIGIAPGTAGVSPKLALSYSSQGGNGPMGIGWSLSGLSAVGRCPQTLAQDGVRGSVNYDAADRFCLDGQRLILVSGTYGGNGAQYRTEHESFSKIISYGYAGNGPAWFEVWTKSGQIMEYGNTANSRIEAQGKTTAAVWALSRVQDTKGNYFTVTYTEDAANGDYYPQRIDYTGNTYTAVTPNASVRFTYAARTDITPGYHAGSVSKDTVRMTAVQSYVGENLVKDYRVSYDYLGAGGRSRVTAIQECSGAGACLPATTFGWLPGVTGFNSAVVSTDVEGSGWSANAYARHFADINGDGRTDLILVTKSEAIAHVFLARSDGTLTPQPVSTDVTGSGWSEGAFSRQFVDLNNDGRADLVLFERGEAETHVFLANANGSFAQQPVSTNVDGSGWKEEAVSQQFSDINGDGHIDLVLTERSEARAHVFFGNSNGTFSLQPVSTDIDGSGWNESGFTREFMDINGDGRADLVLFERSEAGVFVFLANANGTFAQQPGSTNPDGSGWSEGAYEHLFADTNGDGKPDLVMIGKAEATAHVFLNKGDGSFLIYPMSTDVDGSGWNINAFSRELVDVNADGRTDLVLLEVGEAAAFVFLAKADGSFAATPIGTDIEGSGWSGVYKRHFRDIDGDGKPDLVLLFDSEAVVHVSRSRFSSDLFASVSTALGASMSVTYKPITDDTVYTKDSGAVYPIMDMQLPMHVVSSVASSNGLGGTLTTTYKYGGLKAELTSRGMLGFRWTESTQAETGVTVRTEYSQTFPYTGMPVLVKKTLDGGGNNGVLSQETNTFGCIDFASASGCTVAPGKRYFPFVSQSSAVSYDLSGAAFPTVTTTSQFDEWGNATQITVNTGDGHVKTTTNTYANDATAWHLGRLLRATVTSTTP